MADGWSLEGVSLKRLSNNGSPIRSNPSDVTWDISSVPRIKLMLSNGVPTMGPLISILRGRLLRTPTTALEVTRISLTVDPVEVLLGAVVRRVTLRGPLPIIAIVIHFGVSDA